MERFIDCDPRPVAATSMAHFYTYSGRITASSGPWKNAKNRYVGVQFVIKGETHYGWARLSVTMHRDGIYGISAVLTGYAYETVANRPIIAGKTRGQTWTGLNQRLWDIWPEGQRQIQRGD